MRTDVQNHLDELGRCYSSMAGIAYSTRAITAGGLRALLGARYQFISTFSEFRKRDKEPGAGKQLSTVAAVPFARQSRRIRGRSSARDHKELSPSELAQAVGRSVQRVSTVLGALRLADVVRYDTDGKRNRYRLKHPRCAA